VNGRYWVGLLCLFVFIQNHATGAVRCAHADLSNLAKVVYVSPQGTDGAGCGQSTTSPCKTIKKAIENCSGGSCGVLVRYGVYDTGEPVNIADGISLYGSCVFDETPYRYRSTIMGNPAIQANGINKPTVVEGFVILGSAAVKAGEASVAFKVSNSTGLVLRENVIASGPGGRGGPGNTPSADPGQSGGHADATPGGAGGFACPSNPPPASTGRGGKGADWRPLTRTCYAIDGSCECRDRSEVPAPVGQNGANSGSVPGGAGGRPGTAGCSCRIGATIPNKAGDGLEGDFGKIGPPSTQGGSPSPDTKGSFAGTTWQPNVGGAGAAGQVGSGGGGGGAGGFAAIYENSDVRNGYAGGGGGGGGCGGPGGIGAQQGGASVPLVLFTSSVAGLTASNALIPGPGGQGGKGGTGARGGNGGSGGSGYRGAQTVFTGIRIYTRTCSGVVPGFGGRGGNGGQGGAGGGGAGGNGGPSFAIALVNSSPLPASDFIIYRAQPGGGGDPGPGGQNDATSKGADGKAGLSGFSDDQNSIVSFTSINLLTGARP
jgi:hypothetical protein